MKNTVRINRFDEGEGTVQAKVGDWVGFKCDIEQSGRIKSIHGRRLVLENPYGFEGGYIGGDHEYEIWAHECWA